MLKINGKTFMNLQEAVQWLLDNNALPFQSSANYVANTEIGMGTIVNPSPAKVRIGSLIFFADSKVSTVIGLTENGFIVSDQYNDLVDDVVYVSNVALNASGHLIVTLSNGGNIDAGLIKQISSFSIDGSQHLIATYNDGSTNDLGAIFSGNINISGNLTVTGGIAGNAITGDSIIENMSGYSFTNNASTGVTVIYAGVVKNGNKITMAIFFSVKLDSSSSSALTLGQFVLPADIDARIYPFNFEGSSTQYVDVKATSIVTNGYGNVAGFATAFKYSAQNIRCEFAPSSAITAGSKYFGRYEVTFLLSDNLA